MWVFSCFLLERELDFSEVGGMVETASSKAAKRYSRRAFSDNILVVFFPYKHKTAHKQPVICTRGERETQSERFYGNQETRVLS